MVEYSLLLALIALLVVTTVSVVGRRVAQSFCGVSSGLAGNTGSAYAATVLRDCPIAYWRLDESGPGTAKDSSGHGNVLTYSGNGGTLNFAQPGAIAGDADTAARGNLAIVGVTGALIPPNDFSLETWVNLDAFSASGFTSLLYCESYLQSGFRMGFSGSARPQFWTTQSGGGAGGVVVGSAIDFTVGTWHQVVVTFAGDLATVYLDGRPGASGTGAFVRPTTGLMVGGYYTPYGFSGVVDDTAIYATALSPTQVANHYRAAGYALP